MDPQDTPLRPTQGFLNAEDTKALRHGLRGVSAVEVRQIGLHPSAGEEVMAFLQAEGLDGSFRQIERMVPGPGRRFVFRYRGGLAELTVAPEVAR